ncbi:MAG: 23S rRNA (pseudouridine(1915)-N(3))-methyltransferase RlmH [Candidatus Symbiobacter sp.]|nr:23S rRNA (pseudouridine(1915)-N(3))-methyltransferase RlmH [Candidatus Symbiobacter sp.]
MRISIIAIGKMRGTVFAAAFEQYQARLHPPVTLTEIDDKKSSPKEAQGKLLLAALPPRARLVALDEAGETWSSLDFFHRLAQWRDDGHGEIAFVLGGADGLSQAVRDRATSLFSLGRITLPHLLARVVLIEQIYRATTIQQNHPYHRG